MSVVEELKALVTLVEEELGKVSDLRKENASLREHAEQVTADQAEAQDRFLKAQADLVDVVAERDVLAYKFDKLKGLVEG